MTYPRAAIAAEGLGKRYDLSRRRIGTLREAVAQRFRSRPAAPEFWALRDVTFTIEPGETVGIVGKNGAGKSTLLKLLSRITAPSAGFASINGRVGSLLEVGAGFHADLSGRDNIFLNAAMLGMEHRQTLSRFDEIVAFSGVEPFLELPVKRYSSGMYLRLAFAVSAYLDSEILLVDEALSVGDVAFQQKSMARLREVVKQGRTVLFVSHNLNAIQSICPRTMIIDEGRLVADGPTSAVLDEYARGASPSGAARSRAWAAGAAPSPGPLDLRSAAVRPLAGGATDEIEVLSSFIVGLEFVAGRPLRDMTIDITLLNEDGVLLFNVGPDEGAVDWDPGIHRFSAIVPGDLLNRGTFSIGVNARQGGTVVLQRPRLLTFDVSDPTDNPVPGLFRPALEWRNEFRSASNR